MSTTTSQSIAERLAAVVDGPVIGPDAATYDTDRRVFMLGHDLHPAAIVRPAGSTDVATVLAFARTHALPLAVRSGRHSGAGHGTSDGVVLDLQSLKDLEVDVAGRTAWAGTGLTAGEVTAALGEHGLAVGFGDTGSVGIGGITLGGGLGFLSRKFGATVDDVLAAEVVTASGEVVEVDDARHPDLFWAIRGGGGNFGVVTRLKFRLHEIGTVLGGMLMQPATAESVTTLVRRAQEAPEELTLMVNVMAAPPMPFIPEELHGSVVAMTLLCWAGDLTEGQAVVDGLRSVAPPLADMVQEMPYAGLYAGEEPPGQMPHHVAVHTMYVDSLDLAAARSIVASLESSDAAMRVVQIRPLGGAVARVPADATAYAHRDAAILVNHARSYATEADHEARLAEIAALVAGLQDGEPRAYVNFLAEDGPSRIHEAYPTQTYERLVEVKTAYDPGNLFRINHNIPPRR